MRATPERAWVAADSPLMATPWIDATALAPDGIRLVVVAPHPDDETLIAGGLIASLPAGRVRLVAVSDGEASHGYGDDALRTRLAERRRREQSEAFGQLGHAQTEIIRWHVPDGELAANEDALVDRLRDELMPSDVVVTTAPFDGHPDHEACARACRRAHAEAGGALWFAPVWFWHWTSPDSAPSFDAFVRVRLSASQQAAKAAALACFHSQRDEDPDVAGTPIVPPDALAHFERPFETYLRA